MNREELINLLGTIAKSGSGAFRREVIDKNANTHGLDQSLIGQFGVGFYSAFVVSDWVEVLSKKEGEPANLWKSDGEAGFEIGEVDDCPFERGTRITLKLKSDHSDFAKSDTVKKAAEKYSGFVAHPLFLNLERVNIVSAIWSRDPREVEDLEYKNFWEKITNTTSPYRYKLHYVTESPLSIKAVLYFPASNPE